MATVPIEILTVGSRDLDAVPSAMALANAEQDEFEFHAGPQDLKVRLNMHAYDHMVADDFFNDVERIRAELRGFHPFVIVVVDSYLAGSKYTNLFGSHRASKGIAIVTSASVADVILPRDRMIAYFVYYLARYALSFLSPKHRNHEDSRGCVVDRKLDKRDIVASMRARALCDDCRKTLILGDGMLSASQFSSADRLFSLAGRILTEGFEVDGRPRLFIGSSSEGLAIANKLQELLSDTVSSVIWNQGTVFGLGSSTLEALEAAVLEFNHAVFVFTPDDQLSSRGELRTVARDNVLFELGMFVRKIGPDEGVCGSSGREGSPTTVGSVWHNDSAVQFNRTEPGSGTWTSGKPS